MRDIVGVVPAAGMGKRMWPYHGPKELLPVGYHTVQIGSETKTIPMVVGQYVLHAMHHAGVNNAYVVVSVSKWEILKFFMSGAHIDMHLGYLCQDEMLGMPGALDTAYPWVNHHTVLMGMPDTILEPSDCFAQLLAFHNHKEADLSLGVFPTQSPQTAAPVLLDPKTGHVLDIFDKPAQTTIFNTWGIAIWNPVFTELMHHYVHQHSGNVPSGELLLSNVFLEAMRQGLKVYGNLFQNGKYHDVGTPEGLLRTRLAFEYQHVAAMM